MKMIVFGGALAMAWCVAAPFAQQQPAPTQKAEPAHKVYVLTGCLNPGASATAAFKLTDASSIGQAPAGAAESGAVGTSGQKPSYELRPASGANAQGLDADALNAHAGRRVEVTVRPVDVAEPAAPTAASGAVQAPKSIEPPAPERFTVTAIKRATGSCP
jgi:hypothetical protein